MAEGEEKSKIRWDDSKAETIRAKSCTVASSREEISLFFGPEQTGEEIRFTNRIILNPFTARQFATALERIIQDYEVKFGPLQQINSSTTRQQRIQKGSSLFELVKGLEVSIGYERSFKMLDKTVLANRFLLGVSKREIAIKANDRLVAICEKMNMPSSLLEIFRQCLFDGQYVHFGFEEDLDTCLCKVYVEFWDSISEELKRTNHYTKPYILHLGFKWDPFNNEKKALTRYTWYPRLTGEEIIGKVAAITDPDKHRHLFESARELTTLALERMPYQDIIYLEATEQGNPRKSFDINIYRGGLQVGELYRALTQLAQHYGIPPGQFHRFYDPIKTSSFGHLAGGINRDGKDFCTIYHGVESLGGQQPDSATYRHAVQWGRTQTRIAKPVEETDEQAEVLLNMVRKLDVPFGFERSFKMAHETFLPERFLAGFELEEIGCGRKEDILDICRQIKMPDDFLSGFEENFNSANIALFGFEKERERRLYKVYLEFTEKLRQSFEAGPARLQPFLLFLGFKWDLEQESRKALTRYTCFPSYIFRDMWQKAANLFSREKGAEPTRILGGIMDLASHRAGPGDFLYLEADETASGRKSFDINLYKAGLLMSEIYPLLVDMTHHYQVSIEEFHRTYEAVKSHVLGHVAGGIDREGRDFMTLYYADKAKSKGRPGWDCFDKFIGKQENGR
ncbi:MAG: DUF3467 domain-containing protein [Syntrophaceae bacterium]|nr:DUF3467 domain-containing protein [Syntrophaceae bacterium]